MNPLFQLDIHRELCKYLSVYQIIPLLLTCKQWKIFYESSSHIILEHLMRRIGNNLSVNQFPGLTFKQVLHLSFVYYPIPASIKYYDCYTLFYRACELQYEDPTIFLRKCENKFNITDSDLIAWICYKFNRLDTLKYIYSNMRTREELWTYRNRSMYRGMIDLLCMKLEMDVIYGKDYKDWESVGSLLENYCLFTPEQLLEIVIFYHRLGINEQLLVDIINGNTHQSTNRLVKIMNVFIHQLGINKVEDMLGRYMLPSIKTPRVYLESTYNELGFGSIINMGKLRHNPDLAESIIPNTDLGAYYITSGRFVHYLKWICNGNKLGQLNRNRFGMNAYGFASMNSDFVVKSRESKIKNMPSVNFQSTSLDRDYTYIRLYDSIEYDISS